jgi:hypothetical protein
MWPAFVGLTIADGVIGSTWPPTGASWNGFGAALAGCFLNLICIIVVAGPLGRLLRRFRGDLPKGVARDYAGTTVMLAVTAVLIATGLAHRSKLQSDQRVMNDAISRAQAFIGDRAPAEFRRNLSSVDTFTIEAGRVYRTCVPSVNNARREYCVIVRPKLPFDSSVRFDGYTPNAIFSEGVN